MEFINTNEETISFYRWLNQNYHPEIQILISRSAQERSHDYEDADVKGCWFDLVGEQLEENLRSAMMFGELSLRSKDDESYRNLIADSLAASVLSNLLGSLLKMALERIDYSAASRMIMFANRDVVERLNPCPITAEL